MFILKMKLCLLLTVLGQEKRPHFAQSIKRQLTFWKPSPALQDLKRQHPTLNMQAQHRSTGTSQRPDLGMQYQVVQGMTFLMVIATENRRRHCVSSS
ncbi:hypothetical protein ILYODFUR_034031 [Ilyodon furcidens]|uniref:Secreted protein n=1 Tax=Ilyodon furcidens TaxID=33524 RepID=A0ABV0UME8_9TELE